MYYIFSVKNIFGKNKNKIVKKTYATFFYFPRIFLHQNIHMNTGPHEKSGVEEFFGDPFLTKLNFSKIMRSGEFLRWRAEILRT